MADTGDGGDDPPTLTDADVGKTVIGPMGTPVGTVTHVENGVPVVELDEGVDRTAQGLVGMTSGDGRLGIPADRVLTVGEETVHVR
jgi:hypothetical protein